MKTTFKFEGGDQLAKTLAELSTRAQRRTVRGVLIESAEYGRSAMARNAPKSDVPPHMSDHITVSPTRARERGDVATVAVGPSRDFEARALVYPKIVEMGNARQSAQPFARQAFESEVNRMLNAIRAGLWREVIEKGLASTRGSSTGGGLL